MTYPKLMFQDGHGDTFTHPPLTRLAREGGENMSKTLQVHWYLVMDNLCTVMS